MSREIKRSAVRSEPATAKAAPLLLTAPGPQTSPRIVAASALMFEDPGSKEIAAQICRLAPSDATILITGETGTGKEIVARHIHSLSRRGAAQFVAVNCAALTESLAESELFGHERGAFTGAQATRVGWFEAAQGGTLFLDEIGELSLPIQAKLLRVLQEREVVRVGSQRAIKVDIRLLTATNVNLQRAVQAGRFRQDLYYRINLATLSLAPLRERPGDLWPLARHFLRLYREKLGLGEIELSPEALSLMGRYPWPGNIRELENVIHYSLLVSTGPLVKAADLHLPRLGLGIADAGVPSDALEAALRGVLTQPGPNRYQIVSDALVRAALEHCGGNQVRAAAILGISRNVLRAHLARLGVVAPRRRTAPEQSSSPTNRTD